MVRPGRWLTGLVSVSIAFAAVSPATARGAGASTSGDRLWVTPNGSQARPIVPVGIVVSPDGSRVFQTGVATGAGHDSFATVAVDAASGARLWIARYRAGHQSNDQATAISVSPDGDTVFVTGESGDTPQTVDYATIAYDAATGAQRWVARFDDANHGADTPWSLAVSPDGALVFVTGHAGNHGASGSGATVAYDAATGLQVWKAVIPARGQNSAGLTVVASPDGSRVFVIGRQFTATVTITYDAATGAKLWTDAYQSVGIVSSVAANSSGVVSRDGSTLYVSGTDLRDFCCRSFAFTIAYDALTGARRWTARFPDHPGSNKTEATSIAVSPDGAAVYVTGYHDYLDRAFHFTTLAYDTSDGHLLWRRFFKGDNELAQAFSIAVSPDSRRVVVTGHAFFTASGGGVDYATIAYDAATGAQAWLARYAVPQQSYNSALAVAIDPSGSRVFVTGYGPMIAYAL